VAQGCASSLLENTISLQGRKTKPDSVRGRAEEFGAERVGAEWKAVGEDWGG